MPQPRSPNRSASSSRSKRAAILNTATELFGRDGYEHSKWADVAAAVGIGSTALYHYFESKLHCLYEIMAEALEADREKFERITGAGGDFNEALVAVLNAIYDLSDLEFAWATFLTRGMEQGVLPQADARLMTRAVLGLYNSVWHWYRPRGDLKL